MSDQIPDLTLDKAVAALGYREEYQFILETMRQERERLFKELGPLTDAHEVVKLAGRITGVDEMLDLLTPME